MISRRSDWLAGLVVGVLDGVLFFLFPALAVVLLGLFAVLASTRSTRLAAWSGALVGAAAAWLVLLGRSAVECEQFNAVPGQGCTQPDLTGWIVAGGLLLVAGLGLGLAAWRR